MLGDNISSLKKLPDNSIDSVVTDPPYGLSFMNKKWDYDVPSIEFWKEVYRVLKPGGHVLSFGGTRTYHRMVVNIEDAGFEIRDQIMWLYGSGFPKSLNVGKTIEKYKETGNASWNGTGDSSNGALGYSKLQKDQGYRNQDYSHRHQNKIEVNNEWEGWGTALKPANEPICVARKPLSENSVAENVIKWKTGGINIDGCRVGDEVMKEETRNNNGGVFMNINNVTIPEHQGRFPANLIFECICDEVIKGEKGDTHPNPDCPCRMLDEQSGIVNQGHWPKGKTKGFGEFGGGETSYEGVGPKDKTKSGASRFFYNAKVSKSERNMGLDGFEDIEKSTHKSNFRCELCGYQKNSGTPCKCEAPLFIEIEPLPQKNNHPTVKPINLMTYLCRLVTPENGIVLDPFMGSGSTGIAAQLEGFRFCGMEMDEDYFKIAEARINSYESYRKFKK